MKPNPSYKTENILDSDKVLIKSINKKCYYNVVIKQFGSWDLDIQEQFFEDKWNNFNLKKIIVDNQIIGIICIKEFPTYLFLSEIQIDPEFQNKGYGTKILKDIFASTTLPIKLQVLFKNKAFQLYKNLGFYVTDSTDTHYLMQRDYFI